MSFPGRNFQVLIFVSFSMLMFTLGAIFEQDFYTHQARSDLKECQVNFEEALAVAKKSVKNTDLAIARFQSCENKLGAK